MSNPTQKQQLDDALAKIADLEPKANAAADLQSKLDDANGKVTAAEGERDKEKLRADQAAEKITELEGKVSAADGLQTKLDEATAKIGVVEGERDTAKKSATDAENKLKSAEQTHAEQLAGRGIKPFQKAAAASTEEGKTKVTADEIKAQYEAIEDREDRYAFYQKHKAVLLA